MDKIVVPQMSFVQTPRSLMSQVGPKEVEPVVSLNNTAIPGYPKVKVHTKLVIPQSKFSDSRKFALR